MDSLYSGYEQEEGELFLLAEKFDKPFRTLAEAIEFAERAEALNEAELEELTGKLIGNE